LETAKTAPYDSRTMQISIEYAIAL